ncbi:MAG: carbohydrate-binding module family 20 domain-containing protein [bacterium]
MKRLIMLTTLAAVCVFCSGTALAELGWGGGVWPNSGANVVPTGPVDVYGQVFKDGVTPGAGQGPDIEATLTYLTDVGGPYVVVMTYQGEAGNNDEYTGQIAQAHLAGATWVESAVDFHDLTDDTWWIAAADQNGTPGPQLYNVTNVLPNDVEVTFTLCMSGEVTSGPPCVIGSAAEIGSWGTGVIMTQDLVEPDLYAVTVTFLAGGNPSFEYKFKKDACATWEGAPNRPVTLPNDGTTAVTLAADSWNNLPMGCGMGNILQEDFSLCIQVCMEGIENTGAVCVTGNNDELTNWGNGAHMYPVGPNLYQYCLSFEAGIAIPLTIEYKFRKDGCETWESVPNRTFVVDNGLGPEETAMYSWDDQPADCVPVPVEPASWGTVKSLYR